MSKTLLIVIGIACALVSAAGIMRYNNQYSVSGLPVNGLQASLSKDKETYKLGEHIELSYCLKNIGQTDLKIYEIMGILGNDRVIVNREEYLEIEGNHITCTLDTTIICAFSIVPDENYTLIKSGESHKKGLIYVNFNNRTDDGLIPIKTPGVYYIAIRYSALPPVKKNNNYWSGTVTSNTVKIIVK